MQVRVNGDEVDVPEGLSVSTLLEHLGRDPTGPSVAVAVNMQVVPRAEHPERVLAEGDRVDIVGAVGGG